MLRGNYYSFWNELGYATIFGLTATATMGTLLNIYSFLWGDETLPANESSALKITAFFVGTGIISASSYFLEENIAEDIADTILSLGFRPGN